MANKIAELSSAVTPLVPATALLWLEQPGETPEARKVTMAALKGRSIITEASGTTAAANGWIRIASVIGNAGRGAAEVTIMTQGGSSTPHMMRLLIQRDWTSGASISVIAGKVDEIIAVRVGQNTGVTEGYLEMQMADAVVGIITVIVEDLQMLTGQAGWVAEYTQPAPTMDTVNATLKLRPSAGPTGGVLFGLANNQFGTGTGLFTIGADGRVAFGHDDPVSEIHIKAVAPIITYEATNAVSGVRYDVIGQGAGQVAYRWLEDNNELMRLDTDGVVTIVGDLNVGKILLDVSSSRVIVGDGTDGGAGIRVNSSAAGTPFIQFEQNGDVKGSLKYSDAGDTMDLFSDGNIEFFPGNVLGLLVAPNVTTIQAASGNNAELYFSVNSVNKYRIGLTSASNNFRLRDETAGVDRLLINSVGTVTIPGVTKLEGYAWVRGSISMASSGALMVKMGLLAGPFVSSTDCFMGVQNTGGPGLTAGDLILATRSNLVGGNSIRFFSGKNGTMTESFNVDIDGDIKFLGTPYKSGLGAVPWHGSSSHASAKITVSTSAPSGGANGDLWLEI